MLTTIALVGLLGCAGSRGDQSGVITRICNQPVGANATVIDVRDRSIPHLIGNVTIGGGVILQVSGCNSGVDITLDPPTAGTILRIAAAADGKPAGVVIKPLTHSAFTVVGVMSTGSVPLATVHIPQVDVH